MHSALDDDDLDSEPQEEVEALVESGLEETAVPIVPALGDDVEAVVVEAVEPLVDAIEESALATPNVDPPPSGEVHPPELPVRFP